MEYPIDFAILVQCCEAITSITTCRKWMNYSQFQQNIGPPFNGIGVSGSNLFHWWSTPSVDRHETSAEIPKEVVRFHCTINEYQNGGEASSVNFSVSVYSRL
jgi:hypothetical protein